MQTPKDVLHPPGPRPSILFYTHALVGGGAERVWAQTAAGLAKRGYQVEFCVDWDAPENAHLIPETMVVHRLGRNHVRGALRLRELLVRKRFFAVLSAVGASNLKLLTAKALSFANCHIILSQHGFYEAESRFLGKFGYLISALTSRLSARTIVVSDALRDDLIARFWAAKNRVHRMYNAIDIGPLDQVPSWAVLRERPDHVLTVGRLVPEKGHMDLLNAMTMLPPDVTLTIAGEGAERPRLEAAIQARGLASRVRLAGYLTDLSAEYARAKVFALPSHTEAFGNVVVEAMGSGIPIVATVCGGPHEILDNGRYGTLVPVGDASAMANALMATLRDPPDPAALRARAQAFAVDNVLDEYEMLLISLPGYREASR